MSTPAPAALPQLVTVSEVCAALSVGRTSVYKLAASGELHAIKIGSATRFDLDDVRAYIEKQRGAQS